MTDDPTPTKKALKFVPSAREDFNFLRGVVAGMFTLAAGIFFTVIYTFGKEPLEQPAWLFRILGPAMIVGASIILVIGIRAGMRESGKRAEERLWRG